MLNRSPAVVAVLGLLWAVAGCTTGPQLVPMAQQKSIDRSVIEYPAGFALTTYARHLDCPTALTWDRQGSLILAEGGLDGSEPRIIGIRPDGTFFSIYPYNRKIPFLATGFVMYGPIGGLLADQDKIFVSHRDANGLGVITALGYDGSHTTIVAGLPAQGDYGVTDLAMSPTHDRLYFGVGTATNSGVVGVDNWTEGWLKHYRNVCDQPAIDLQLNGYKFSTPNPWAGLFGGADVAVTGPFQPFGSSSQLRVPRQANGKPNGVVCSVAPSGGDLRIWASGLRYPRGLGFDEYGQLHVTNDGMELRGTRPVKDDPDAFLHVAEGAWFGWPDYSTDGRPITDSFFWQNIISLLARSGYDQLSFLIDHEASNLVLYDRPTSLLGDFPPLSGAAKFVFVASNGPFQQFRHNAIVALHGDHAPFATGGLPLLAPVGYKVVRVDPDTRVVHDFVVNTAGTPASMQNGGDEALERPIDVKFGPDGAMYILDSGPIDYRDGTPRVSPGGGRIFRLAPAPPILSTTPPPGSPAPQMALPTRAAGEP